MVAQVRLVPEASTFVALVVPSGTSFARRSFELALSRLKRKAQWTIVIVVSDTPLR